MLAITSGAADDRMVLSRTPVGSDSSDIRRR